MIIQQKKRQKNLQQTLQKRYSMANTYEKRTISLAIRVMPSEATMLYQYIQNRKVKIEKKRLKTRTLCLLQQHIY